MVHLKHVCDVPNLNEGLKRVNESQCRIMAARNYSFQVIENLQYKILFQQNLNFEI